MNGVPAIQIIQKPVIAGRVILYLHGGGYVFGGAGSHGNAVAHLGQAAGATVFLPLYRLAPENPYPAALEDAMAAYRWLLEYGISPRRIGVAGDSAGAGLAVATLVAIRDAGLPMPGAAALLSPLVDLTMSGDSMISRAKHDAMLSPAYIRFCAQAYCAGRPGDHPGCSPLFANLRGLPPLLIQTGSEEILYSDSERLAERARLAQVDVTFVCYQGLGHVFQLFVGWLRESDTAIAEIGTFFLQRWGTASQDAQQVVAADVNLPHTQEKRQIERITASREGNGEPNVSGERRTKHTPEPTKWT
jgi:acetyl esterase/lipase